MFDESQTPSLLYKASCDATTGTLNTLIKVGYAGTEPSQNRLSKFF